MKNVTLSADERLIDEARELARKHDSTLNAEFRKWLADYTGREQRVARAMETIERLRQSIDTGGRKFTRDEMNER